MKCPKCGFVSHPGLSQCKKCGRNFSSAPPKDTSSLSSSLRTGAPPGPATVAPPPLPPLAVAGDRLTPSAETQTFPATPQFSPPEVTTLEKQKLPASFNSGVVTLEPRRPAAIPTPLWREELSGRVQKFRRKRARLRSGFDSSTTLDLEFDREEGEEHEAVDIDAPLRGQVVEFGNDYHELQNAGDEPREDSILDEQPVQESASSLRMLSGAAVQAGETPLSHQNLEEESVEIILDSVQPSGHSTPTQWGPSTAPQGILGRRFLAGLVDAFVLLAGSALFATIFWAVCLRSAGISPRPANLIALASIAACLIFFYFGISVSLTATTPGLAWMGLEVRNLDGELPSVRQSLWRAFGYLVSSSALFLGFIWALFDHDGLAWHDLMSETYVISKPDSEL